MKGLFVSDCLWLGHQKVLLLMSGAMAAVWYLTDVRQFIPTFLPLYISIFYLRTICQDLEPGQSRFFFSLPFSRRQYVLQKYGMALLLAYGLFVILLLVTGFANPLVIAMGLAEPAICISLLVPLNIRFKNNAVFVMMGLLLSGTVVLNSFLFLEELAVPYDLRIWLAGTGIAVTVLLVLSGLLSFRLIRKESI